MAEARDEGTIVNTCVKRPQEPASTSPEEVGPWTQLRAVLVRAVGKHCPPELASVREDLVQVALLKLAERPQLGEGNPAPEASYAWKVAFTVVVDELRKRRRGQAYAREVASQPKGQASSPEVGLAIGDCLEGLLDERRVAVTLYLQGFRMLETATATGWTEKRVENLLYRGLKDLRLCLEEKGVRDA